MHLEVLVVIRHNYQVAACFQSAGGVEKSPKDHPFSQVKNFVAGFHVDDPAGDICTRAKKLPVLNLGGPRAGYRIRPSDLQTFLANRYGEAGKAAA